MEECIEKLKGMTAIMMAKIHKKVEMRMGENNFIFVVCAYNK